MLVDWKAINSNWQSAIKKNNQQLSIVNQQSSINNQQSTIINQQSTIINHQSTINNQQSSIINHQSSINNQQSTINNNQLHKQQYDVSAWWKGGFACLGEKHKSFQCCHWWFSERVGVNQELEHPADLCHCTQVVLCSSPNLWLQEQVQGGYMHADYPVDKDESHPWCHVSSTTWGD